MPVSLENRQKLFPVDVRRIRRSLKRLLKELRCEERDVCVLLVDDNKIREINNRYLNRDRPTNVISFAMAEGEFGGINPQILGDIVISVETASRDASASQLDLMDEIEFLLIHGLLHLLGYDHEEAAVEKAAEMKARERELFFFLRRCPLD
ncbi:MAG: rRNA maturation RNase YbeY [Syntrophobacterales bacterium RBG_19FT_COMBO_59_10]|nr:MAG: rRNA maturation RNase YbeY [Syntrophobacterales bacterium RBG_19FT_COMBO_59_10]